jgi:hypothetical protein
LNGKFVRTIQFTPLVPMSRLRLAILFADLTDSQAHSSFGRRLQSVAR